VISLLEKYEKENETSISILEKQIANDKLLHAYMFVGGDQKLLKELAKKFVKEILGKKFYIQIENETLVDFKIIETDKMIISKEEIKELQRFLRDKPIACQKKIYIIMQAEKLSVVAANALLKDLEEPNEDVIGILTTTNIDSVIETLHSRCGVLYFGNTKEENEEIFLLAKTFVKKLEKNIEETHVFIDELVLNEIKEKKELDSFFGKVIDIYNEKLHEEKTNKKNREKIMKRIKIFMKIRSLIFVNVNIKLMFDKLFFLLKEEEK